MAHYNAINESRFTFSHSNSYLPVHGLEGIIKEENVIMRFRNLKGQQIGFHKAMNYLYRPREMEDMPAYEFYSDTEFINISKARKDGIEYFEYTENHAFNETEAVVYRKTTGAASAVPSFPWNWLGSTKSFQTSLLSPLNVDTPDHKKKEEYAFRFMLLFVPFRSKEDLVGTDGSHQKTFQRAFNEGKISDGMIQIAENIQTIHNSLSSSITENTLSAETALVETCDFEKSNEDDDKENYEDLLATIGELFVTLTNGDGLKEDSKSLDLKFGNKQMETSSRSNLELETVIEYSNLSDNHGDSQQQSYPQQRFCSTTNNLNTLAMRTTITRSQANEDPNSVERKIVSANGTWQSISKWGENEGLDGEQQTAFEILAATYVLSFYDEAIVEATNAETYLQFTEKKNGLCKLARQNTDTTEPLCMFITGPAGAGKCKSRYTKLNSETKT
jgi:hypothetical protein